MSIEFVHPNCPEVTFRRDGDGDLEPQVRSRLYFSHNSQLTGASGVNAPGSRFGKKTRTRRLARRQSGSRAAPLGKTQVRGRLERGLLLDAFMPHGGEFI